MVREDQRGADPTLTELCIKAPLQRGAAGRAGESGKGEVDAEMQRAEKRAEKRLWSS